MAAAGSFAAVSSIFGSPVIGAVLILEAAGLGGRDAAARAAAGAARGGDRLARLHRARLVVGASARRRGRSARSRCLRSAAPGWGDFGWTILLAAAVAVGVFAVMELARLASAWSTRGRSCSRSSAGLAVGGLAIAFAESTGGPTTRCSSRARSAFGSLFASAATISLSTLALLLPLQGPRVGHLAGQLPRRADVPGAVPRRRRRADGRASARATRRRRRVAALTGAACVATLRLPLSSVMIASMLTVKAGSPSRRS